MLRIILCFKKFINASYDITTVFGVHRVKELSKIAHGFAATEAVRRFQHFDDVWVYQFVFQCIFSSLPFFFCVLFLLLHLTPPIIASGAITNNMFIADVPAGIAPTELHPPPVGAVAVGVAVTTIITGVCVGGTGVDDGADVSVGTAV